MLKSFRTTIYRILGIGKIKFYFLPVNKKPFSNEGLSKPIFKSSFE